MALEKTGLREAGRPRDPGYSPFQEYSPQGRQNFDAIFRKKNATRRVVNRLLLSSKQ